MTLRRQTSRFSRADLIHCASGGPINPPEAFLVPLIRSHRQQMNLRPRAQAHRKARGAHSVADQDIGAFFLKPAGQIPVPVKAGGFDSVPADGHLSPVGVAADGQLIKKAVFQMMRFRKDIRVMGKLEGKISVFAQFCHLC